MANRNYLYAKLENNSFKGVSESSYMFSLYDCVLLTGNPKSVKSEIIDEAEELKTFLAIESDFDYGVKRYLDFNQWIVDNYEKIMTNSQWNLCGTSKEYLKKKLECDRKFFEELKRDGAISFWCEPFELLEMEEFDDVPEVYSSFFDTINNIDCELNKILESTNYMSIKDSKILKMLCYLFNKGKKDYPYEYTLSNYLCWSIKK